MNITLKQLRYFDAALRFGSIARAAEDLNISQSSITAAIDQIERVIGAELFRRIPAKGVVATRIGEEVGERVSEFLGKARNFESDLLSVTGSPRGTLRLACFEPTAPYVLPPLLQRVSQQYPEIRMEIIEGNAKTIDTALREGTLCSFLIRKTMFSMTSGLGNVQVISGIGVLPLRAEQSGRARKKHLRIVATWETAAHIPQICKDTGRKQMIRRTMMKLGAAALLSTAMTLPAVAQDVTMNLGFGAPEASIYGRFARLFKDNVEEISGGEIEVKLRCCNQISSEDEAFKAMQLGTVDGFFITANNVSPHWPLMDVTVLPYIFENGDHLERVLGGPVGASMKEKLQAATSVHLLAFGPALYRDFYNSKRPINTMADMEGLKIRVPKNEVMLATFEAFGAEPVPLAWSETPTALQTGTVDGGDNGTSFIRDMKFYEFEPHLVILEHFVSFSPLFASNAFMQRLSDEQRAWVQEAADNAGAELEKQVQNETEEIRNWLVEEGGMEMTRPDKTEFIEAAQKVQKEFAEDRGPAFVELVEQIQAAAE